MNSIRDRSSRCCNLSECFNPYRISLAGTRHERLEGYISSSRRGGVVLDKFIGRITRSDRDFCAAEPIRFVIRDQRYGMPDDHRIERFVRIKKCLNDDLGSKGGIRARLAAL